MELMGGWVIPVLWGGLAITVVVSALRASRSPRAFSIGIYAVSALWLVGGAAVNLLMLIDGDSYEGFADQASTAFVREQWASIVMPHQTFWIGLLAAFEASMGLLVLWAGRPRQVALSLLIAFDVALVSFGWGYLVWAVPMVTALALLLRAERRRTAAEPGATTVPTAEKALTG